MAPKGENQEGRRRGRYDRQAARQRLPESTRWTDEDRAELDGYVADSTVKSETTKAQLAHTATVLSRLRRRLDAKHDRTGEESMALVRVAYQHLRVVEALGLVTRQDEEDEGL